MNLASKLTLMRVILVPFFVAFMLIGAIPLNYLWMLSLHNVSGSTLNDWQGNIIAETINDAHFAREQGKSVNWLHK